MKYLPLCLLLLAPLAAVAADRDVLVNGWIADANGFEKPLHPGDVLQPPRILEIFFLREPCPLQIAAAKVMRRYWDEGSRRVGCWGPTTDGYYLAVDGFGTVREGRVPWETFNVGKLHEDGTITIVTLGADQSDWVLRQLQRPPEAP